MIKKRKILGENVVCTYDSSNTVASSYNSKNQKLTITFGHGMQYTYDGVTSDEYKLFEENESQGRIFNTIIKPKPFTKGDKVDVKVLFEDIEKLTDGAVIKTELDKPEKQFMVTMEAFLIKHNKKNDLDLLDLVDMKYFLEKVIESKTDKKTIV